MATLADSLVSTTSRVVRLRIRPDLSARRQRYHGEEYWVVKEPVGLNYFRFHEEEFAILQMLDGETSLDEIKEQFEDEFAPQKITFQDLQQFIGMLHRSGLVISEASGQGRQLKKRRDEKKRKELLGKFTNVFAVRFRGVDPERVLTWLYRYTAWIFHPICVAICLAICFSALLLVAVQFDVFRSRLPEFHEFFNPNSRDTWIYMGLTMAIVKIIHEFGHGLSCKHYGGECHELGFMLLVFTPCLYCNVSDSWMLPNKWHRVVIGAAGMYVEVVMASIATFIWWFSEPGLLNHLALNVMFICSVSTLIFNGNPLLRFDGYYIMMDIVEIPNLRQKSTEVLKRFMVNLCLGLEQPDNPFLPQKNRFFFGLYTVAAVIYRWLVVFSIVMFLNAVLEPMGLKVLGQMVAFMGFFGLFVQPLYQLGKFFYMPGRMHKVKRHRVIASLAVVGAVIAAVVFVPLPHSVKCAFEVKPLDAMEDSEEEICAAVYVDVPGLARQIHVREGEAVTAGEPIVSFENLDMELQLETLKGDRASKQTQLRVLRRQRHDDEQASARIAELTEAIAILDQQIADQQDELARLEVTSPVSGFVIPAPVRPDRKQEDMLPERSGSPLAPQNVGAAYAESELLCYVGDPSKLEALLVVDQSDIDFVDEAMRGEDPPRVKLQFDAYPGISLDGQVVEVALVDLKATSPQLSAQAGGGVATTTDASGVQVPMSTSYQARVPLDQLGPLEDRVTTGMLGRAQIYTRWQSLGDRLFRYLARTFHFEIA
jgi:putative peptide zinc metalloprotease protein